LVYVLGTSVPGNLYNNQIQQHGVVRGRFICLQCEKGMAP
jgi:hypothetical protein